MMIATLNEMPHDPCNYMKEWLLLHYYDEEKHKTLSDQHKQASIDTVIRQRDGPFTPSSQNKKIGVRDLENLKDEIAKLKNQRIQILHYKQSFWSLTHNLREYCDNSTRLDTALAEQRSMPLDLSS